MMSVGRIAATFFLGAALTIIWPAGARAKTVVIDDSGSQALEPSVTMRWKSAAPSRSAAGNVMIGTTTIRVRINVTPWFHRSGHIYLALPVQKPGPIGLSWITQGRFLPGQVASGNRVLVYAGPIASPFMEDTLTFQFSVNGALMARPVPVTYRFEMDEG
jgi:hypothetical protein